MITQVNNISFLQKIASSIISFFNKPSMHVKISKNGLSVLKDRQLTRKLVDTIISKKTNLENGESIVVESGDRKINLSLSGSLNNADRDTNKNN